MVYAAFTIGLIVGVTMGAVLIDLWFVQPLARENHHLSRHVKRVQTTSDTWREMAEHTYLPSMEERAKVHALLDELAAQADTLDHSKSAELRVVGP